MFLHLISTWKSFTNIKWGILQENDNEKLHFYIFFGRTLFNFDLTHYDCSSIDRVITNSFMTIAIEQKKKKNDFRDNVNLFGAYSIERSIEILQDCRVFIL